MKKYLLISEVEELLSISQSSLRYIEKTHPRIQISKIRGRRYYKASDLLKIAKALGITSPDIAKEKQVKSISYPIRKNLSSINGLQHNSISIKPEPKDKFVQLDLFASIAKQEDTYKAGFRASSQFDKIKAQLRACKERLSSIVD